MYQLKIQINLEGYDIWRRVLVPSTYSFRHLHNIIQTVFDWQDYHLHEFVVEIKGERSINIIMNDDPETLEYIDLENADVRQERFVCLSDIFLKFDEVIYEYDFGDSWQHNITLEKIIKSKSFNATFIEGNGERPPEDVGGESGYKEYLEIIENEEHPMHDQIKAWAEDQKERMFSTEKINRRLKQAISGYRFSTFVFDM